MEYDEPGFAEGSENAELVMRLLGGISLMNRIEHQQ
jgi:hypothetical protein